MPKGHGSVVGIALLEKEEAIRETFLKTIVRDYLTAGDPAAVLETNFVQKVESENA